MTKSELLTSSARNLGIDPIIINQVDDDGLYHLKFVCAFFGGSKPLHPATLYRGMKAGRYPRPVQVGPNSNRWVGRTLKATKTKFIEDSQKSNVFMRRCQSA